MNHRKSGSESPVSIHYLIRRLIPDVMTIETLCFEQPWTEAEFDRCLSHRGIMGRAAFVDDLLVGYVVFELYDDRYDILNLAVDPDYRRQGIGEALISERIAHLSDEHRNNITAQISETNVDAQLFFSRLGFIASWITYNAYESSDESGIEFIYRFGWPTSAPDERQSQNACSGSPYNSASALPRC